MRAEQRPGQRERQPAAEQRPHRGEREAAEHAIDRARRETEQGGRDDPGHGDERLRGNEHGPAAGPRGLGPIGQRADPVGKVGQPELRRHQPGQ